MNYYEKTFFLNVHNSLPINAFVKKQEYIFNENLFLFKLNIYSRFFTHFL